MSHEECALFESWFWDTVESGAAWVKMPIQLPQNEDNIRYEEVIFNDVYEGPTLKQYRWWEIKATLITRGSARLENDWAVTPDLFLGRSIIDVAINREWPEA